MWLVKVQRVVEPQLELQLGLREKLWQVEHHRVICSDVKAQEPLLERLLDEASALYNRTQDPSVDEQTQNALQEAYSNIYARAEVWCWIISCKKKKKFLVCLTVMEGVSSFRKERFLNRLFYIIQKKAWVHNVHGGLCERIIKLFRALNMSEIISYLLNVYDDSSPFIICINSFHIRWIIYSNSNYTASCLQSLFATETSLKCLIKDKVWSCPSAVLFFRSLVFQHVQYQRFS